MLTAVQLPTPADEAVRDLARARDDAREDLQRCRQRLGKLLLRRGLHYHGRNWTRGHREWIESLTWTPAAERVVVDDYLLAIDHTESRLIELDTQLATIAETEPYREPVGWFWRLLVGKRVRVKYPEHVVALGIRAVGVRLAEGGDIERVRCDVNRRSRRDSPVVVKHPSVHLAGIGSRIEGGGELPFHHLGPVLTSKMYAVFVMLNT